MPSKRHNLDVESHSASAAAIHNVSKKLTAFKIPKKPKCVGQRFVDEVKSMMKERGDGNPESGADVVKKVRLVRKRPNSDIYPPSSQPRAAVMRLAIRESPSRCMRIGQSIDKMNNNNKEINKNNNNRVNKETKLANLEKNILNLEKEIREVVIDTGRKKKLLSSIELSGIYAESEDEDMMVDNNEDFNVADLEEKFERLKEELQYLNETVVESKQSSSIEVFGELNHGDVILRTVALINLLATINFLLEIFPRGVSIQPSRGDQ